MLTVRPGRLTMSSISASSTSTHVNGTTCLDSSETSSKNGAKNNNNSSSSSGHSDPHDKFTNNGEATDDLKATQQQIKNLEMELKHARDALSGTSPFNDFEPGDCTL